MKEINVVDIERFREIITSFGRIVIISHTSPDGDAVGSSLGLSRCFKSLGQPTTVVFPDAYPFYYDFLVKEDDDIIVASECADEAKQKLAEADVIVAVDFCDPSRVDFLKEDLLNAKAKKIMIDHHLNPHEKDFDVVFSDNTISSASEFVYWVVTMAFGKEIITKCVAECIYTGICTDTGSFSYSCNSPTVYLATAHLIEAGVNASAVNSHIYNSYSRNRLLLLGYCINKRLRIFDDMKMAYFYVSKEDQQLFDAQKGDLEGVVNYTLMMQDIEVGALIKENSEGVVRISFRSKHDFNVNEFAKKYFDGGGHRKASGATSIYDFDKTCSYLEECFRKELLK